MTVGARFLRTVSLAATLSFVPAALSQDAPPAGPAPGGGGGAGAGAGGGIPSTGGGNPGGGLPGGGRPPGQQNPFPTDPRQQQQDRFPEMQRPIFLSGKVVMEDGTSPPEPVTIERICNGNPRPEGYTDSKGRFSFQLGQNLGMMADASVSSGADSMGGGFPGAPGGRGGMGGMNSMGGVRERDLMGCELRAVLPGFRSEIVNLSGRRFMDNPDVGTIILRRLANVEGLTLSATSLAAPKDAKKAFEKGRELAKKNKLPEAQKEFEKAVTVYPKYANAWSDLGRVHEMQNRAEDARTAYGKALEADGKLVQPYVQMALMYARENKWQECAELSGKAIKLNPYDYPQAYFYNAVANLNTQNLEAAEKSARDGLKSEGGKKIAKMHHVLGIILAQKNDVPGAIEHLKGYLGMLPANNPDVATVKNQLAQLEKVAGNVEAPKTAPAQQQ